VSSSFAIVACSVPITPVVFGSYGNVWVASGSAYCGFGGSAGGGGFCGWKMLQPASVANAASVATRRSGRLS
jgi:hypothetical protein